VLLGHRWRAPPILPSDEFRHNPWRSIRRRRGTASPNEDIEHANAMAIDDRARPLTSTNDGVPMPNSKKNGDYNSGSEPKLLSGGNPQIPKGEGDEPAQAYIAAMPGWKRSLGERLDGLIVRTVPDVHKAVKWNQPFYGHEGEGWFLAFRCYTKYVQLQFFRGTSLDPVPLKASKHDEVRYFDIYEDDDLDEDQLVSWIEQASSLPGVKM
jgi:hypothetical protein